MKTKLLIITLLFGFSALAQNLLTERIWKISTKKRSIFFDNGVFHSELQPMPNELVNVRTSFIPERGYERLVFDFNQSDPPKIYGHISKNTKKVTIDFFKTSLTKTMATMDKVKYVKEVSFFNMDKDMLSVEVKFKESVSLDVFYLTNPGRLVVDIKR